MSARRHWLLGTLLVGVSGGLLAWAKRPRPRPAGATRRPLPVGGMFAARYPRWAASAIFDDGARQFFDSPAHLFLYLQNLPRYAPGRRIEDLHAMFVADHRSGGWMRLEQAVFVHGSRVRGPMRNDDLPAFAGPEAANAFIAEAGGAPAQAAGLRRALPEALQAQAPHRH